MKEFIFPGVSFVVKGHQGSGKNALAIKFFIQRLKDGENVMLITGSKGTVTAMTDYIKLFFPELEISNKIFFWKNWLFEEYKKLVAENFPYKNSSLVADIDEVYKKILSKLNNGVETNRLNWLIVEGFSDTDIKDDLFKVIKFYSNKFAIYLNPQATEDTSIPEDIKQIFGSSYPTIISIEKNLRRKPGICNFVNFLKDRKIFEVKTNPERTKPVFFQVGKENQLSAILKIISNSRTSVGIYVLTSAESEMLEKKLIDLKRDVFNYFPSIKGNKNNKKDGITILPYDYSDLFVFDTVIIPFFSVSKLKSPAYIKMILSRASISCKSKLHILSEDSFEDTENILPGFEKNVLFMQK